MPLVLSTSFARELRDIGVLDLPWCAPVHSARALYEHRIRDNPTPAAAACLPRCGCHRKVDA